MSEHSLKWNTVKCIRDGYEKFCNQFELLLRHVSSAQF